MIRLKKNAVIGHRGSSKDQFQANWSVIFFIGGMHLLGLTLWPLYVILTGSIQWAEVLVFCGMMFLGFLGIGVGYHRAFSHRAHRPNQFLRILSLIAGASTAEGSAIVWCADHRRHHRHEDTDRDPYNVKRSFWWAHMGWMFGGPMTTDFSNCRDLERDPWVRHQHHYYLFWMLGACFGIPLLAGFLLGRPLEALLLAGFTRLFVFQQLTYLINSMAHYMGRRPYCDQITARDSLICAILTSGEGWHNYHHRFPFDYRNGHRWYHWDPTKWLIQFCWLLGLTKDLKTTRPEAVEAAKEAVRKNRQSSSETHWDEKLEEKWDEFKALTNQEPSTARPSQRN
ncbi:MAG: acyl-CoA desaturase [Bradymonadales bacterium]|nr:MAG: acyl-CoA desaturase [Bradymonadales bacterium]